MEDYSMKAQMTWRLLIGCVASLTIFAQAIARAQVPAAQVLPPPLPASGSAQAPLLPPPSPPTYTINLKARHACVTPHTKKLARVDGGFIDVASPSPQSLIVTMTGTAAANSYLGCSGAATAEFELAQELEITCSDPKVQTVALTLDSALVGFVRSKGHAGAAVRVAEVSVTPEGWDGTPLSLWYPPFGVTGKDGRLCNQHLPPVQDVPMPVGRYVISARFALDTQAKGVCDDHAVADFSPDTSLPSDWVRTKDPFQGVSKKPFGFTIMLSAAAPSANPPSVTSRTGAGGKALASHAASSARSASSDAKIRKTSSE
jgi:hypothetical protein